MPASAALHAAPQPVRRVGPCNAARRPSRRSSSSSPPPSPDRADRVAAVSPRAASSRRLRLSAAAHGRDPSARRSTQRRGTGRRTARRRAHAGPRRRRPAQAPPRPRTRRPRAAAPPETAVAAPAQRPTPPRRRRRSPRRRPSPRRRRRPTTGRSTPAASTPPGRMLTPAVRAAFGPYEHWRDGYATTLSSRPRDIEVAREGTVATIAHELVTEDRSPCGPVRQTFDVSWRLILDRRRLARREPERGQARGPRARRRVRRPS